jgi:hypothetical protein
MWDEDQEWLRPVLWPAPNVVAGRAMDETSKSTANLAIVLRIVRFQSTTLGELQEAASCGYSCCVCPATYSLSANRTAGVKLCLGPLVIGSESCAGTPVFSLPTQRT